MEVINKDYDKFRKIQYLDVALLVILFGISFNLIFLLTNYPTVPELAHGLLAIAVILTLFALGLKFLKFRIVQNIAIPRSNRVDPILLFSSYGVNLHDFVEELQASSDSVKSTVQDIHKEISNLNEKIQDVNKDVDRVFQISANLAQEEVNLMDAVDTTSDEIQFMFEIVNTVIFEIDSKSKAMEQMVHSSEEGKGKVLQSYESIEKIAQNAKGMMKLIDFINQVTKQTNLLAINAAIEATHSGDQGKGFTVIADEIRNLAVLTSQNARQITELLKNTIDDFEITRSLGQETGTTFQYIADEVKTVSGTIAEVIQTISELKNRGTTIMEKAKVLDQTAERVKSSSGEVYGEVVSMNNSLIEIQEMSAELSNKTNKIQEIQKQVEDLCLNTTAIVNRIVKETDRYIQET